jgi:hypothetical protein
MLVLIDVSNFIFNYTFQVLCCVGASSICSFFQVSAQKEVWYRDGRWTCWPRDVSKTWNYLMEEIADHAHSAVRLSCKIHPKFLLLMPRMCECCRAEQCVLRWNDSLALRTFQYAQCLEHHEDSVALPVSSNLRIHGKILSRETIAPCLGTLNCFLKLRCVRMTDFAS